MYLSFIVAAILSFVLLGLYIGIHKKKLRVRIILFIPTIVFGAALYTFFYLLYFKTLNGVLDISSIINSVLRAVLSTAKMFTLSDDYEVISNLTNAPIVLKSSVFLFAFWLCHIVAASISVTTVISLFGKKLLAVFRRYVSFGKEHYVIFGVNSKSLCFARNILTEGERRKKNRVLVIFIDETATDISKEAIRKMGAIILEDEMFCGTKVSIEAMKKAGLKPSFWEYPIYAFAFTESEITNFQIAKSICEESSQFKLSAHRLKGIYTHSDSEAIEEVLADVKRNYYVSCFCEEDLAVRKFFEANPIYKRLEFNHRTGLPLAKNKINIIILGFGNTGKKILRQAILTGQFKECTFYAAVFDSKINSVKGTYQEKNPGLFEWNSPNYIEIDFFQETIGSVSFYKKLQKIFKNDGGVDYIISCLGDDELNFSTITDLNSIYKNTFFEKAKKPIMAAHIADKKYHVFNRPTSSLNQVTIFGDYDEIFSKETIINEELDALAKAINSVHGGAEWEKINTHDKESSRAAAAFLEAQLNAMGLELVNDESRKLSKEEFEGIVKAPGNENLLNNLGETEHLRWNAFHFASGWVKMPLNEVENHNARRDFTRKVHACLTTWHGLLEVGNRTNRDYQELDKNNALKIHDMIEEHNSDEMIKTNKEKMRYIAWKETK